MVDGLYVLQQTKDEMQVNAVATDDKLIEWHNRLNHTDMKQIAKIIAPILKTGEDLKKTNKICEGCAQGQAKRISYKNTHHYVAQKPLESLNTDLCGPSGPRPCTTSDTQACLLIKLRATSSESY